MTEGHRHWKQEFSLIDVQTGIIFTSIPLQFSVNLATQVDLLPLMVFFEDLTPQSQQLPLSGFSRLLDTEIS